MIWRQILLELQSEVSAESFDAWLDPVEELASDRPGALRLAAPNAAVAHTLEIDYKDRILQAAARLCSPVSELRVEVASRRVASQPNGGSAGDLSPAANGAAAPQGPVQQTFDFKDRAGWFDPRQGFETFVVGACNEFAHAAARAVAANPAEAYNPLYIYGGVGMGKTHLMQAIGQSLQRNFPGMRVVYVSAEQFMNEMIFSLRYDRMSSFHERFRTADALLVDDIQTLGQRERTQEEFFHTFNTLYQLRKQIVISSDLPPKQVPGLVDRLRSRFAWGLMADIQPPDLETKMAILDRKAEERGVELSEEVRGLLASHLKSNIRELEGLLIRLIAISSVAGSTITPAMAKQALRSLAGGPEERTSAQTILAAVAREFQLEPERLIEKGNARAVCYPRQIAMYLVKESLGLSLPEIGRVFGGKHHTTVLHAVGKIDRQRRKDSELNALLHRLSDRFN